MFGKRAVPSRASVSWFNFKGRDQQRLVGELSGGERNRVHLAKLLKAGSNVLLLDEPTNDLDVDTLRALEEAVSLGYFRGIMNQLDAIDAAQPESAAWTAAQRALARQFQFDAMSRALTAAAGTS